MKSSDLGRSVDEVEQLIRKHEAFEKLLASQDEKVKNKKQAKQTIFYQLEFYELKLYICFF